MGSRLACNACSRRRAMVSFVLCTGEANHSSTNPSKFRQGCSRANGCKLSLVFGWHSIVYLIMWGSCGASLLGYACRDVLLGHSWMQRTSKAPAQGRHADQTSTAPAHVCGRASGREKRRGEREGDRERRQPWRTKAGGAPGACNTLRGQPLRRNAHRGQNITAPAHGRHAEQIGTALAHGRHAEQICAGAHQRGQPRTKMPTESRLARPLRTEDTQSGPAHPLRPPYHDFAPTPFWTVFRPPLLGQNS